jgi:hypothetical protein
MSAENRIALAPKLTFGDLADNELPELARFVAVQSGRGQEETLSRLTWLLLQNPARHADDRMPLGCTVRSSTGELAGCILYLPQMFVCDRVPLLLLGSSCFYVDEPHRGSGGALFLKFARAANRHPLFGNSANSVAAQLWKARGATPIPDSDHELLGITHWPPVAEELAIRRGLPKFLARTAGAAGASLRFMRQLRLPLSPACDLIRLSSVEEVMNLPLPAPSNYLTAQRNEPYLRWRYFSQRDPSLALFRFHNRRTRQQTLVTVNERRRGHRGQIRSLNLLDVFPKPAPDELAAIVAALNQAYRGCTHMIVLRNLDEECQRKLIAAGFRRRSFESPNGWLLAGKGLLPTQNCYFVPADGDWII